MMSPCTISFIHLHKKYSQRKTGQRNRAGSPLQKIITLLVPILERYNNIVKRYTIPLKKNISSIFSKSWKGIVQKPNLELTPLKISFLKLQDKTPWFDDKIQQSLIECSTATLGKFVANSLNPY